jgi:hypothetical protein
MRISGRNPSSILVAPLVLTALLALAGCAAGSNDGTARSNDVPQASTTAQASPAPLETGPERPAWTKGDRWAWSDEYALQVSKIEGKKTTFNRTDADDQWQQRDGIFWTGTQSASTLRQLVFRSADPSGLFPLAVGKEVVFDREYLANGELRRHRTSWVVEGKARIEVPAGAFDTWIITRRTRSIVSNWAGFERWWYSPEAKHYARLEYQYGDGAPGVRVLMEYDVK